MKSCPNLAQLNVGEAHKLAYKEIGVSVQHHVLLSKFVMAKTMIVMVLLTSQAKTVMADVTREFVLLNVDLENVSVIISVKLDIASPNPVIHPVAQARPAAMDDAWAVIAPSQVRHALPNKFVKIGSVLLILVVALSAPRASIVAMVLVSTLAQVLVVQKGKAAVMVCVSLNLVVDDVLKAMKVASITLVFQIIALVVEQDKAAKAISVLMILVLVLSVLQINAVLKENVMVQQALNLNPMDIFLPNTMQAL